MLTQRQQELLDFLKSEQRRHGVMPSSREIQHHFGFASQTAAMDLLRALERKGVIRRLKGKARAVVLPDADEVSGKSLRIPVLGSIAAGMPESGEAQPETTLNVDASLLGLRPGGTYFALKVRGDSMIEAHIVEGDVAILEQRHPKGGDVVAALIDGETTLKRFLVRDSSPFLRAENAAYPDLIPAEELRVQGVMVGLIRPRLREVA